MNNSEFNISERINVNINYILTFLFILIEIIGILGNILVIISVQVDARMRRSLTNQLIVRVASCDLIILLFNIPDIIQFVSSINGNWILNQLACKLIRTILVLAQYASVLTMCALTIERFIGIVYPLRSKFLREKKHVILITFIVWIFSLLCSSPNLIFLRLLINNSSLRRSCLLRYSEENPIKNQQRYIIHKSIESIIFYFIPFLLQLYCYAKIARQLYYVDETLQTSFRTIGKSTFQRTQKNFDDEDDYIDNDDNSSTKYTIEDSFVHSSNRNIQNSSQSNKMLIIENHSPLSIKKVRQPFTKSYSKYRSSVTYNALKSRRNVIKMLALVVLIYFISFSPQVIVFILFDTHIIKHVPQFIQTPYFIAFTMLLVTISSASNPIIYAIFCSKFRQSFAKILRRLFCCCQTKFNYQLNQRALSLQQIPRATYRFNGRIKIEEKRQIKTNENDKYSS